MSSRSVHLVLFDIDGTLVDHDSAAAAAVEKWLTGAGCADSGDPVSIMPRCGSQPPRTKEFTALVRIDTPRRNRLLPPLRDTAVRPASAGRTNISSAWSRAATGSVTQVSVHSPEEVPRGERRRP